jgi:protein-S-isoprenylcysteine O-methyltransferase Ste14
MFIAAGKINYLEGWLYFAISMFGLVINIVSTRNKDELISERSAPGANTQAWDKKILGGLAILTIISYAIAGLDSGRFHWSAPFNSYVIVAGVLLVISGQIIFAVAKYQNNFFSSVVRIQGERKQNVCDQGLYKFVRHPGYLGMVLSWIGFPLVLNSIYSSIPVFLAIIVLIIRTSLEDRFLRKELVGYEEYMRKTKYRMIPFVW